MIPTQKFAGVVMLERLGQVIEEVQERGGNVIAKSQRQTDQRQIVRFHRRYRDRFCLRAARNAALAAAAS